jgi:hypothetical protein
MPQISETLATADQLHAFADREKAAEELLPRLIRRLVLASVPSAKQITFPTGKSINVGGWDGHVECSGAPPYIPVGISGWELSVRKDQKGKADEDYDERTTGATALPATERSQTTFIHWTMRKWSKRQDWSNEQRGKNDWKEVKAYDAGDLETWLINHLAVHLWVSKLIGVRPQAGAIDIISHWTDWSETAEPPLPAQVLTHGYENQRQALLAALTEKKSVSVQWEKADLAIAFVAACLSDSTDPDIERLAARCVYVKNEEAYEELASEHKDLILVLGFTPAAVGLARKNGHTLVFAFGRDAETTANIVLTGRRPSDLYEAMKGWEPSEEKRRTLAEKATRKFTSFYRSLVPAGTYQSPLWGSAENVPLLIAGRWDGAYVGDRDVIERLSGKSFAQENERAIALTKTQDALLHQAGTLISIVDLEDAWSFLGRHATDLHLDTLGIAVKEVFSEVDPVYETGEREEADQLAMFSDRRGKLKYSMSLRQGIAETLCYPGASGEDVNPSGLRNGETAARIAVRSLFESADNWMKFCSLAPWFREFAEAGPDEFLAALERDLKSHPEKIRQIFRDDTDGFFGSSSPHTPMLWALELLAWSREYLVRSCLALARLSNIDPGGKLSNRPLASLRGILLSWHPGTLASVDHRLEALRAVVRSEPQAGWNLLVQLLPNNHDVAMPNAGAKYRPWGPLWQVPLTNGDVWTALDGITALAIEQAGTDSNRLAVLVESIGNLRAAGFDMLVQQLRTPSSAPQDRGGRVKLRETLRRVMAQHRAHRGADWSMGEERLSKLGEVLDAMPPESTSEKWEWAFSDHAIFELGPGDDFGAKQIELDKMQATAAKEIYDEDGLEGLLALAEKTNSPWIVGSALLRSGLEVDLEEAGRRTFDSGRSAELFFLGLLEAKARRGAADEVRQLVTSEWALSLTPEQQALLLRCLPFDAQMLDDLKGSEREVQNAYWAKFGRVDAVRASPELVVPALRRLVELELYLPALDSLGFVLREADRRPPAGLVATIIEGALNAQLDPRVWGGLSHELGNILDFLDSSGEVEPVRVGRLELIFSRLLTHNRKPKRLNRLVAEDPELFVLLLKSVYRPHNRSEDDPEDQEESVVPPMVAYEVLKGLTVLPGQDESGAFDDEELRAWVLKGREFANEVDRLEAFDETLGEWFSHSPIGSDGIPPHESVREIFQLLESDEFERGFDMGVSNSRGVVMKDPEEGGEQERELGMKYADYAERLAVRWHRVSRAMRSISDSYYDHAKREDRRRGIED